MTKVTILLLLMTLLVDFRAIRPSGALKEALRLPQDAFPITGKLDTAWRLPSLSALLLLATRAWKLTNYNARARDAVGSPTARRRLAAICLSKPRNLAQRVPAGRGILVILLRPSRARTGILKKAGIGPEHQLNHTGNERCRKPGPILTFLTFARASGNSVTFRHFLLFREQPGPREPGITTFCHLPQPAIPDLLEESSAVQTGIKL